MALAGLHVKSFQETIAGQLLFTIMSGPMKEVVVD